MYFSQCIKLKEDKLLNAHILLVKNLIHVVHFKKYIPCLTKNTLFYISVQKNCTFIQLDI